MTIGVYTLYDDLFKPVADITLPVLRAYCERHGYPLTVCTERLSDQRVVWDKIPLLLENLHRHDWSFWIDSDVLITNPDITLESLLAFTETSHFVLSKDINGLNLGVFFIRNSIPSRVILSNAWDMRNRSDIGSEQHALIEALQDSEQVITTYLHQKCFNAYPYAAEYGMPASTYGNWMPGDFAMHLPGMTVERRVEVFNEYLDVLDLERNEEQ